MKPRPPTAPSINKPLLFRNPTTDKHKHKPNQIKPKTPNRHASGVRTLTLTLTLTLTVCMGSVSDIKSKKQKKKVNTRQDKTTCRQSSGQTNHSQYHDQPKNRIESSGQSSQPYSAHAGNRATRPPPSPPPPPPPTLSYRIYRYRYHRSIAEVISCTLPLQYSTVLYRLKMPPPPHRTSPSPRPPPALWPVLHIPLSRDSVQPAPSASRTGRIRARRGGVKREGGPRKGQPPTTVSSRLASPLLGSFRFVSFQP